MLRRRLWHPSGVRNLSPVTGRIASLNPRLPSGIPSGCTCLFPAWQCGAPPPTLAPMRPIRSLLLFLLVVFVGGALLAPWLYRLAQWTKLESLVQRPFHRFVTRGIEALALIGLWPFVRSLGVRSWSSAGIVKPAGQWSRLR